MPADIHDPLPLTESTFLILLSLAPGPKHGYAILKDVETLSHGRVVLSTGTLYGALKRLLDQVWIRRVQEPSEKLPDRNRKAYALTQTGRRVLKAEVERLQRLVASAVRLRAAEAEA
jgi:DNA-binding PadR family transcriptional regulator